MMDSKVGVQFVAATMLMLLSVRGRADDKPVEVPAEAPFAKQQFEPPAGLTRLAKDRDIWIDLKRKRVVMDGVVCLRAGQLEMFACPIQTKEHESIIAVNCSARDAHAGLIAVGGMSGRPARFEPEYSPATGSIIDIMILWHDQDGKKRSAKAQEWVRNVKTGEAMKYDWVFAGSGFWRDPDTGENFYHADAGDFICVSNFPSATLDLPVESTQANSSLLFESFTENIPAKGTPVRLVLTPRPAEESKSSKAKGAEDKPADKAAKANQKAPKTVVGDNQSRDKIDRAPIKPPSSNDQPENADVKKKPSVAPKKRR